MVVTLAWLSIFCTTFIGTHKWILNGAFLLPIVKRSKSTKVEKGEVNTDVKHPP